MSRLFHNLPILLGCSALGALASVLSCLPPGVSGQCQIDEDCTARGQICNAEDAICVDTEFDATSTENPAQGSFTNKIIPFFRGQVCTPVQIQSGATFPVEMTPCLHPCLTVTNFKFKHFYECTGSNCNLWALYWMRADGDQCPADAFSRFDASMCDFTQSVSFDVGTTLDTGPIQGNMVFEVPFVTNAEMAGLSPTGAEDPSVDQIKAVMFQYPQDPSRMVNNGAPLTLLSGNPVPPPDCSGAGCECFNVGY